MAGLVYLVQPAILIDTNRYKIGRSSNLTLKRIKSYGINAKIFCIFQVDNVVDVEAKLIKTFNEKFDNYAGNEYYKGDIREMTNEFINIIHNVPVISSTDDNLLTEVANLKINDYWSNLYNKIEDLRQRNNNVNREITQLLDEFEEKINSYDIECLTELKSDDDIREFIYLTCPTILNGEYNKNIIQRLSNYIYNNNIDIKYSNGKMYIIFNHQIINYCEPGNMTFDLMFQTIKKLKSLLI